MRGKLCARGRGLVMPLLQPKTLTRLNRLVMSGSDPRPPFGAGFPLKTRHKNRPRTRQMILNGFTGLVGGPAALAELTTWVADEDVSPDAGPGLNLAGRRAFVGRQVAHRVSFRTGLWFDPQHVMGVRQRAGCRFMQTAVSTAHLHQPLPEGCLSPACRLRRWARTPARRSSDGARPERRRTGERCSMACRRSTMSNSSSGSVTATFLTANPATSATATGVGRRW